MIHRSRHHAATFPARRGMRASWLRRRIPDEADAGAEQDSTEPGGPAPDTGNDSDQEAAATPGSDTPPAPAPVRPAFGHPTF